MNLDSISQELDRLYQFEISEYISRCDELKKSGYRIFRNDSGQHKVVAGQNVNKEQVQYTYDNYDNGTPSKDKKDNILVRATKKVREGIKNFKTFIRFIKFLYRSYKNNDLR